MNEKIRARVAGPNDTWTGGTVKPEHYHAWRKARSRAGKAGALAILMKANDVYIKKMTQKLLAHTRYDKESMTDDCYQAARIGFIRALEKWDPKKGALSTIAYLWVRHELQQALRHATPISRPKSADLARVKQDEAAAFYAQTGRDPTPEELGVSEMTIARAQKAQTIFVSVAEADTCVAIEESAEDTVDRARDVRALQAWLRKLPAKDRTAFWGGRREDLTAAAKAHVEASRVR